ncbi:hypothetical protein CALCODRAFT_554741 [Calocera cornea HHB12733]|uniref:Uncharacterized protein n=1 Tax=Calocera cornea HHB12733 TaxID=1353952 RepID=A0A165GV01_9BASI|nr:hypothetical protein CALCODRAFT_554741 [Calocera cornea HHB12733]
MPPSAPVPSEPNAGFFHMLHIKNQSIRPTRVQSPAAQAAAREKYQEKKRKRDEEGVEGAHPPPSSSKASRSSAQLNGATGSHAAHTTHERPTKRQATERNAAAREAAAREAERLAKIAEKEREEIQKKLVIDFNTFTVPQLLKYIGLHGLAPPIDPSPLSRDQPPPASYLLHPPPPRLPDPTPANRPQRTSRRLLNARTGYREDQPVRPEDMREPIYIDIEAYHAALAGICARHFDGKQKDVKDTEVVMGFVYAIKTRGERAFARTRRALADPGADKTFRVVPVDRATA